VTKSNEKVPAPCEIRSIQKAIPFRLDRDNREPGDIISADDTVINYCVAEKFMYCPSGEVLRRSWAA